MDYYKKIDKSVFHYGITIPKRFVEVFLWGMPIGLGKRREIQIKWKGLRKTFKASISHINRKGSTPVFQIRWDSNKELINHIRKVFIQTYLAIVSDEYERSKTGKKYRTQLEGGTQEVMIVRTKNAFNVEIEPFINIKTPYDPIFRELIDNNIFELFAGKGADPLIIKSTGWFPISKLKNHARAQNIIYYLVDETKKELYIGSALVLGDRVKPSRTEIPGWSIFKYDILNPKYESMLRRIEHHTIRSYAGMFSNKGNLPFLKVSNYKLVNRNWPRRK